MPDPREIAFELGQGLDPAVYERKMYRPPELFSHLIDAWARALEPPRPTPLAKSASRQPSFDDLLPPPSVQDSPAGGAFAYAPPDGPALLPEPDRLTGGYAPGYSPAELGGIDINDLVRAIQERESGGRSDPYAAINPDSGAIGISQVLPSNVPAWSRRYYGQALSPAEYARNAQAQEVITYGAMRDIAAKHARAGVPPGEVVRRAAAEWYGGPKGARQVAAGRGQQLAPGGYPSLSTYADDTLRRYGRR